MTDVERAELLKALYALKNACEWYQKEEEAKHRMVTGLFAKQRNAELVKLANQAKRNGDELVANYRDIVDQIPTAWYTVPMVEHLIVMAEHGCGENVKDLVKRYKWNFRDLTEAGVFGSPVHA